MELTGRETTRRVNTQSHRKAVAKYAEWLRVGKKYRETVREREWVQSEKQYMGDHWFNVAPEDPSADLITVNMSFCVDEQTEALTQRGWLRYGDLQVGDMLLTYNLERDVSEWQPAQAVNVFSAAPRQMLSMEGQSHSSMTTLDHRWPSVAPWGRRRMVVSKDLGLHDRIPITADRCDLPQTPTYPDALVEIVAWFWTEGHIPKSGSGDIRYPGRAINITQSHEVNFENVEAIRLAFKEMWGDPTSGRLRPGGGPQWQERQNGQNTVFWTNADAGDLIQRLAPDKVPSHKFILSLTDLQLRLFIDVSMLGDGSEGRTMIQSDRGRAEAFQFALMQAGIASTLKAIAPPKSPAHNQGWMVSLRKQRLMGPAMANRYGRFAMETVEHDGLVWCPTTPNGTWMARRNGTTYFTGNSTVMTIVPFVTGEEPSFIVEPFTQGAPETLRNARLQQAWLNRTWRNKQVGAQEALADSAVDWLIYGDGIMKASYEIRSLTEAGGDPTLDKTVADLFIDRVSPWDFWIDPNASTFHEARWMCHRITVTKEELDADPRYKNTKNISFQSRAYDANERRYRVSEEGEGVGEARWASLYEFYDTTERIMVTFVDGSDVPLRWVEGIVPPFEQIANYPIPNSPYHFGELEQIWSLQQELNKTRSQMSTHRRRNTAKVFIKDDAITKEGSAALQSAVVGEFVPIKGDQPLDGLVAPVNFPNLSADVYNAAEIHRQDILEITGVSEYQRGVLPNIRRTATEASIIEGASNAKTRYKLRQVERAARGIGILLLAFAKEVFPLTSSDEMELFITGSDADGIVRADPNMPSEAVGQSDVAGRLTPDVFDGEYQVDVEVGSTELRSPAIREQKFRELALALVQTAPVLQQLGIQLNLRKPLELWFEAAGIADVEGMFAGAGENGIPPQLQQLLQQAAQGQSASRTPGPGPQPALGGLPSNPTSDNTGALAPDAAAFAAQ